MKYLKKSSSIVAILSLFQLAFLCCKAELPKPTNEGISNDINIVDDSLKIFIISKIIDGDTYKILIDETEYKVRLIGVDTPESSYNFKTKSDAEKTRMAIKEIIMMGKTATKFVKKYITAGDSVRLEFDIQRFDRYDRILAYVYLMDGRMFNEILVREGYAQIMTIPPNVKYQNLFLEAQRDARNNNRGFWSDTLTNHY